jgi:hypothetical protein
MSKSWYQKQRLFQIQYEMPSVDLPNPLVAQECAKYGMRAVFYFYRRTYLIGSGDTLYGEVGEESCIETELATTIAELFVTGPFRSIP